MYTHNITLTGLQRLFLLDFKAISALTAGDPVHQITLNQALGLLMMEEHFYV